MVKVRSVPKQNDQYYMDGVDKLIVKEQEKKKSGGFLSRLINKVEDHNFNEEQRYKDAEFEDWKRKQDYLDPFEQAAMDDYNAQKAQEGGAGEEQAESLFKSKDKAINPIGEMTQTAMGRAGMGKGEAEGGAAQAAKNNQGGSGKGGGEGGRTRELPFKEKIRMTRKGPKTEVLTKPEEIINSIAEQAVRTDGKITKEQKEFIMEHAPHLAGYFKLTDKMDMKTYDGLKEKSREDVFDKFTDANDDWLTDEDGNEIQPTKWDELDALKARRDHFSPGLKFPGEPSALPENIGTTEDAIKFHMKNDKMSKKEATEYVEHQMKSGR